MSKNKTEFWICDKCGERIESVDEGWVEWLTIPDNDSVYGHISKDIRIVHRVDCIYDGQKVFLNYNATVSDLDLKWFAKKDGLMDLLSFISDDRFEDKEEVLEIIKRIHIPGYEEARHHFDAAIYEQVFEPNTKPSYYSQRDIEQVINYYRES